VQTAQAPPPQRTHDKHGPPYAPDTVPSLLLAFKGESQQRQGPTMKDCQKTADSGFRILDPPYSYSDCMEYCLYY